MSEDRNIIAETDNYVIYRAPINSYYPETEKGYMLNILEDILAKGYKPIFYENRQHGFVCEKIGVRAKIEQAA